jgi:hypothetical protein
MAIDAAEPPLYGTCVNCTFAIDWNSSPIKCVPEPCPADPIMSSPGRAFENAMSSFTLRTGIEGCTLRALETSAMRDVYTKSRSG